jgi:hypothetical protein
MYEQTDRRALSLAASICGTIQASKRQANVATTNSVRNPNDQRWRGAFMVVE